MPNPSRFLALAAVVFASAAAAEQTDPLASWNEGPAKESIMAFVQEVTDPGGKDYVPPEERIAVFDNDGTLWAEQPMYFQLAFALDRVKALAPEHPEWKDKQPLKAALESDMEALAEAGQHGLVELIMATHAGISTEEFEAIVRDWIGSAKHPKTGMLYTDMVYQPMLELLVYLRDNGFKTFIVSGGGIEFMRPWAERVYGIPPEQIVGSSIKVKYELENGTPALTRLPDFNFIDDKAGKPVGIHYHIGQRPVAAFGNSDGDFEMLEWVTSASGPRFGLLVHHDDAEREFAYDRDSDFGKLDRGLDEGPKRGWTIISMKSDWKCILRFQCPASP